MLVFRDSSSIRGAVTLLPDLAEPLTKRLSDLAEYPDYELHELVNLVVAQPGDRVEELGHAVGVDLSTRPVDVIEAHPGWFELTYVLGDDGFGVLLYVPDSPVIDGQLRRLCLPNTGGAPT